MRKLTSEVCWAKEQVSTCHKLVGSIAVEKFQFHAPAYTAYIVSEFNYIII